MRKLIEEHGLTHLYSEDMFYKVHKISRADFLQKLERTSNEVEREQTILSLYDDEAQQGRKGVLSLQEGLRVIK